MDFQSVSTLYGRKKNVFGTFAADPTLKPFASPKRKPEGMPNTVIHKGLFRWFSPQSHIDSDIISHLS